MAYGYNTNRPELTIARERRRSSQSDLISFPADIGAHTMLMVFKEYEYESARAGEQSLLSLGANGSAVRRETIAGGIGGPKMKNISAIELPIPSNLRDTDILNVEKITQGVIETALGEAIADGAKSLQGSNLTVGDLPQEFQALGRQFANISLEDVLSKGIGALGPQLQSILNTSIGDASRDVLYLLRSTIDRFAPGISRAADRALGSTINPKASLAFEGVELKQHSFSWTLAPKSFDESERLKGIVEKLKVSSLPTYQTFTGTDFKAYLRYPSIVDIYLLGVNPEYFMKFKSSMIRSVNVEYGSSGLVSILKGGKPANVALNIELMELDIHTAEDYGGVGSEVDITTNESVNSGAPGFR